MSIHPLRDLALEALRRRTSVKWTSGPPDVLPMFVAEMDAHPIPEVVEAVERAMRDGDTGYPWGITYAEAWADYAARTWGTVIDPAHTVLTADVMTGIAETIALVTRPGDGVIVNSPVYPPFFDVIRRAGRRVVEAPLGADGRLDLDTIAEAMTRAQVLLLCSPQNPTSVVHTRAELEEVTDLAVQHQVLVVVDEIHAPVAGPDFVPFASVEGSEGAIVAVSASKGFNLAGLKAGLLTSDRGDLLRAMDEFVTHGASHLGVIAHVAALRHGEAWLAGVRSDLAENRRQLVDLLAEHVPGARYDPQPGTYLAWIGLPMLGDDPAAEILARGRLALASGPDFGTGGAGFARMALATTPEVIEEAVRRLASVVR